MATTRDLSGRVNRRATPVHTGETAVRVARERSCSRQTDTARALHERHSTEWASGQRHPGHNPHLAELLCLL